MFTVAQPGRASRASDQIARAWLGRIGRFLLVMVGFAVLLVGLVTAFLPLHLGVPILVVGLMIVLRNSFKARRQFVAMQRAHPNVVFPLRRLLRKDPEVLAVVWQQLLRTERLVLRKRRFLARLRRRLARRRPTEV